MEITITRNKDGNYYVKFPIEVTRGIRRKGRTKENEVLIYGMNQDKFEQFCKDNHLPYESIIEDLDKQEHSKHD